VEDSAELPAHRVRFPPILHQKRGLQNDAILEAVIEGLQHGSRDFGVSTGSSSAAAKTSRRPALELAELAIQYRKKGVVGFDLAGEEKDFPAKHHREAFQLILNHNINSTVHAGEGFGPPSIAQALHYCGAHRIGHGTRLGEDPELLQFVLDHRFPRGCLTRTSRRDRPTVASTRSASICPGV
jgi:adenosine deaminase